MLTCIKKSFLKMMGILTAFVMVCVITAIPKNNSHAEEITDNQLKDMANEIAFIVNDFRAEAGLPPVYVVPYLCDVANVRARECIVDFNHFRPDG